jgi:mannose-1-phosphate guanylyltransferase
MHDESAFGRVLADAVRVAARTDHIVTMGVQPTYPATGFGYIHVGEAYPAATGTPFFRVRRFVEKPPLAAAKRYLATGRYAWNAGMFVWRAQVMLDALRKGSPALADLAEAVSRAKNPARAMAARYPDLASISVDYAVMEKATNLLVASGDFGWDDVGTWSATDKYFKTDARRNAVKGEATLLDCEGVTALSDGPKIAALGIKDVVVVTTKDAVLVADKSRVQDLKALLAKMST